MENSVSCVIFLQAYDLPNSERIGSFYCLRANFPDVTFQLFDSFMVRLNQHRYSFLPILNLFLHNI